MESKEKYIRHYSVLGINPGEKECFIGIDKDGNPFAYTAIVEGYEGGFVILSKFHLGEKYTFRMKYKDYLANRNAVKHIKSYSYISGEGKKHDIDKEEFSLGWAFLKWSKKILVAFSLPILICVCLYVFTGFSIFDSKEKEPTYDLGEYVYLDKEKRIWHSSLECSKLNRATSKSGVIRETPKGAVIYDSHQFCFECVKDDVYNKWMELRKPAVLIDTIIYED